MSIKFINLYASTEDHQYKLEQSSFEKFDKEFAFALKEAIENINQESVDKFLKDLYAMRPAYEQDKDFSGAVATFRFLVDNKEGFLVTWGVEYDLNIMFVKKSTVKEVVDILDKMIEEVENE